MKLVRLNSLTSLVLQFVTLVSGLIIPRLILSHYGSEVNGLNYSISQMLSVISYFDFGVAAVAQSVLYRPLIDQDRLKISGYYQSIRRYFNRLSGGLVFYIIVLCIYYALTQSDKFSWLFTATLIIVTSISLIGQYVLGISNQVLLSADQKIYIYAILNIVTTILNVGSTYLIVTLGLSIQMVKLISSLIFLLRPLALEWYVRKQYPFISEKEVTPLLIPNQYSGMIQHIATTLTTSLDTILLTIFSTLTNVSIYSVYAFPLNGVRMLFESVASSYKSYFGQLLAKEDTAPAELETKFFKFEVLINGIATISSCILIQNLNSFILIYTKGITDIDYNQLLFGFLMIFAFWLMALRIPYTTIINAAGHFKETQHHSLMELVLNLVISISLVINFGLVGVVVGTIISLIFRTVISALYMERYLITRKVYSRFKCLFTDICSFLSFVLLNSKFGLLSDNYISWLLSCLLSLLMATVLYAIFLSVFNSKVLINKIRRQYV